MQELNATYRLLVTGSRLVTAEGEWWDTLTDDMKKLYIKEHPDSKHAKESIGNGTPSAPTLGPTGQGRGQGLVKHPINQTTPVKFGPKDEQTKQALKNLPRPVQSFVNKGGTKSGSKPRKENAEKVKASSPSLARGILKDSVGVAKGLNSIRNMVNGKPNPGDFKKAASFVGTILGTSAMMALLGASGPVGFLTFMAIKHVAAPELYGLVKKSLAKKPPAGEPGYGYWKDKDTWVPLSKKEWDSLTDEEVNDYQKTGNDKEGKFNNFENNNPKDEHGYWDKGRWVPQSKADWERDYDKRGPGSRKDLPSKRRHASVVTATDDEQMLQALIDNIAEYAAAGEIDPDAWKAAIAEMSQSQPAEAEDDEAEEE